MKSEGTVKKVLLGFVSVLLLAFSVASVWAFVSDYQALALVPKGVMLVGHDVSGMNASQLRNAIEGVVSTPMMQPLTVTGDSKSWSLDPRGLVTVGVDSMVRQAYAPLMKATLVTRLYSRLAGSPLPADVTPVYSVDASGLAGWVQEAAASVDRKPVNAKRAVAGYAIRVTPEKYGAKVDQAAANTGLAQALTDDAALSSSSRVASLPVSRIKPKIVKSSFKMAIVVSLSECRVRLFKGAKLVTSYACAPGQPAWPTPTGDFTIVRKQIDAPWINPHDAWSSGMPDVIPGGPDNPMGDRKIAINFPGVFLHGIPPGEFGSIGTHASHGCMRMMPSAIHDLFPRVSVGDPVFIRE
jgi:lipoprotein-anchoring transpeptidase ErfK/SrfK